MIFIFHGKERVFRSSTRHAPKRMKTSVKFVLIYKAFFRERFQRRRNRVFTARCRGELYKAPSLRPNFVASERKRNLCINGGQVTFRSSHGKLFVRRRSYPRLPKLKFCVRLVDLIPSANLPTEKEATGCTNTYTEIGKGLSHWKRY